MSSWNFEVIARPHGKEKCSDKQFKLGWVKVGCKARPSNCLLQVCCFDHCSFSCWFCSKLVSQETISLGRWLIWKPNGTCWGAEVHPLGESHRRGHHVQSYHHRETSGCINSICLTVVIWTISSLSSAKFDFLSHPRIEELSLWLRIQDSGSMFFFMKSKE